jgi:hypothetical protein
VAGQARDADADADADGGLLAELDELTRWLAARAADAPGNFLHLLRLVEAERAWAAGDFRAAALAFDAARHEAAQRQRPWHQALIAEHAARFHLAHGLEQAGYDLLAQARQEYLAWGATAKVAQLDWAYPVRQPPSDAAAATAEQSGDLPQRRAAVTAGTVDLLGIVSASQALSSETSVGRLHARVVGVLSAMTGARVGSRCGEPWWSARATRRHGDLLIRRLCRAHPLPAHFAATCRDATHWCAVDGDVERRLAAKKRPA